MFYRDLVERCGVGNPQLMRLLLRQCLGPPASLVSIHKLYKDFRSQGQALSKDTLYNYLRYLEQSFIVFPLPVAERSLRSERSTGEHETLFEYDVLTHGPGMGVRFTF